MKIIRTFALLISAPFISLSPAIGQSATAPSLDTLNQNEKYLIPVIVISLILIIILVFIVRMERKLNRIEKSRQANILKQDSKQ